MQHSIGQFTLIIGGFTFIIYSDLATDQIWNSFQDLLPASDIFTNLVSFSNNSFIDVPKFTYNGIKIVVLEDLKGNLFSYSNNIDIINVIGRKTYYYHNLWHLNANMSIIMPFIGIISYRFLDFSFIDRLASTLEKSLLSFFKLNTIKVKSLLNNIGTFTGKFINNSTSLISNILPNTNFWVLMNTLFSSAGGSGDNNRDNGNNDHNRDLINHNKVNQYLNLTRKSHKHFRNFRILLEEFALYLQQNNINYSINSNGEAYIRVEGNLTQEEMDSVWETIERFRDRGYRINQELTNTLHSAVHYQNLCVEIGYTNYSAATGIYYNLQELLARYRDIFLGNNNLNH